MRLPRGRHGLSREEVEASQRDRMLLALAAAMTEKGYVGTSVADVLKRSGVGRETFYQLFSSKADCFMQAFDAAGEMLLGRLDQAAGEADGSPLERFEHALGVYLDLLAEQPALARVFLVEVYAAGPEALARRAALQERIVDRLAALVTTPLVADDTAAVRALRTKVVDLVRGALEPQT